MLPIMNTHMHRELRPLLFLISLVETSSINTETTKYRCGSLLPAYSIECYSARERNPEETPFSSGLQPTLSNVAPSLQVMSER